MDILCVVLRSRLCGAQEDENKGRTVSLKMQALRRQIDALYALLPMVPKEGEKSLARQAVSRSMRTMRLVGRFEFLELLPLVRTGAGMKYSPDN